MKKSLIFCVVLVLVCSLCSFAACGLFGGGNSNTGDGEDPYLKLAVEGEDAPTTKLPTRQAVVLKVSTNVEYAPENLRFELVTNTCEATLTVENGVASISAVKSGDVSVKVKIVKEESVVVESAELALNFLRNDISTLDGLKGLKDKTEGSFTLVEDIDLTGVNWEPFELKCTLDGGDHTIKNYELNVVNTESVGLFSVISGSVKNLKIENATITTRGDKQYVGILAGVNKGKVDNVNIVSGTINASYYNNVGGIVGYNDRGTITNCQNSATVNGRDNVGGIAGNAVINGNGAIDNNTNMGEVTGENKIGGVFGYVASATVKTDDNFSYEISNLVNNGSVKGKGDVSGICGRMEGSGQYSSSWYGRGYFTLTTCTNNGVVEATGDNVGGIVGSALRLSSIKVSENKADITGQNYVGGFVGNSDGTEIVLAVNNNVITGKGYIGGIAGRAGVIRDSENNGTIDSKSFMLVDSKNKSYVGGIAGYCTGLVNCKNNSDINVTYNAPYVGGLAGCMYLSEDERFNNCVNNGTITGKDSVGGLVGFLGMFTRKTDDNFTIAIANDVNNGQVNGNNNVGGIVGELLGAGQYSSSWYGYGYYAMSIMTNNAIIIGTGDSVGGLLGYGNRCSEITTSENTADITGQNYVGGYVGQSSYTNIKFVNNNNTITGRGYLGSVAGYAGIIEGVNNDGTIACTGTIIEDGVTKSYVGGLAGYCLGIKDSVNNSDILVQDAGDYVGGLAGYTFIRGNEQLDNNTNNGQVTGNARVGGISGYVGMRTVKTDDDFSYAVVGNTNNGLINGSTLVGGLFGEIVGAGHYSSSWYGDGFYNLLQNNNRETVTGTGDYVGGLVGKAKNLSLVTDSTNVADITGGHYVGGYVGYAPGADMKMLSNDNAITGYAYVGGIGGYTGKLANCTNNGAISSTRTMIVDGVNQAYVGGLSGYASGLNECTNNSDIIVNTNGNYVGGIVGKVYVSDNGQYNGNVNNGKVQGCDYVGGIAGYSGTNTVKTDDGFTRVFDSNRNTGDVTGYSYVGGITGYAYGAGKYSSNWYGVCTIEITNCANEGVVKGDLHYAGIVGSSNRLNTNSNIMGTNTTTSGNLYG